MSKFDQERVVSNLLLEYVTSPDYSEKRDKIDAHEFVHLKVNGGIRGTWCVILFTTSDTAIVQQIELTCGHTRFRVFKVHLSDWDLKFVEWLDDNLVVRDCYEKGMRMYGARV